MKIKDLIQASSVAVGTAIIVIVAFLGDSIEAGGEGDIPAATVKSPKLVCDGVEVSLAIPNGRDFKGGDQPEFELTALNTLDTPARVSVGMTMTAAAPSSPLSRVIVIPSVLWQEERTLTLRPNETKVMTVVAPTNLPAGNIISVALRDLAANQTVPGATNAPLQPFFIAAPQQGIVALSFSTVVTNAEHALVSVSQ